MLLNGVEFVGAGDLLPVTEPVDGAMRNTLDATRERNIWLGVQEPGVGQQLADECWRDLDIDVNCGECAVPPVVESVARKVVPAMQADRVDGPLCRHDVFHRFVASQPVEAGRFGIAGILHRAREHHAPALQRNRGINRDTRVARFMIDVQKLRLALLAPASRVVASAAVVSQELAIDILQQDFGRVNEAEIILVLLRFHFVVVVVVIILISRIVIE